MSKHMSVCAHVSVCIHVHVCECVLDLEQRSSANPTRSTPDGFSTAKLLAQELHLNTILPPFFLSSL